MILNQLFPSVLFSNRLKNGNVELKTKIANSTPVPSKMKNVPSSYINFQPRYAQFTMLATNFNKCIIENGRKGKNSKKERKPHHK